MNIALSTIFIFLLVLPGIAFRRTYFSGYFSKEYFKSSAVEIILISIPVSLAIHIVGFFFVPMITPVDLILFEVPKIEIDYRFVGNVLFANAEEVQKSAADFNEFKLRSIGYFYVALILIGFFAGLIVQFIVRKLRIDRFWKIFRFRNEWHYILTAEILDFPSVRSNDGHIVKKGKELKNVVIDAVTRVNDDVYIYTGVLVDYVLTQEGSGLKTIYLQAVRRRMFNEETDKVSRADDARSKAEDGEPNEIYYLIPGNYFILKYENIINLNIKYNFKEPNNKKIWLIIKGLAFFLVGFSLIYYILSILISSGNILMNAILTIVILDRILDVIGKILKKKEKDID